MVLKCEQGRYLLNTVYLHGSAFGTISLEAMDIREHYGHSRIQNWWHWITSKHLLHHSPVTHE